MPALLQRVQSASATPVTQHPLPWLCQVTSERNYSALPFRAFHGLLKRVSPKGNLFATETFSNSEIHSFSSDLKCAGKPKNRSRFWRVPWDALRSLSSYRGTARETPDTHPRIPRGLEWHKTAFWYTRHNQSGQLWRAYKTELCSEAKRLCCVASLWPPTKRHAGQCFTSDWVFREIPLAEMPNERESLWL